MSMYEKLVNPYISKHHILPNSTSCVSQDPPSTQQLRPSPRQKLTAPITPSRLNAALRPLGALGSFLAPSRARRNPPPPVQPLIRCSVTDHADTLAGCDLVGVGTRPGR